MTSLLIDAGNSRLKWAMYQQGQLGPAGSILYPDSSQSSVLAKTLASTLEPLAMGMSPPDLIVVANVAGQWVQDSLNLWLSECLDPDKSVKDATGLTIDIIVAQENAFGVHNSYQQPELLGADRWAALVAARHLIDGDSCIIDCGSALTIDVLSGVGKHVGGTITPGWEMMKKSLVLGTDAIEDSLLNHEQAVPQLLGSNTREAIEAGIAAACAGAVENVVQRYEQETGSRLTCVLTGGGAEKLHPLLLRHNAERDFQLEPDWVLKGLAIMAANVGKDINNDTAGNLK